ncbi:MAG: hypothetical protein JSV19_10335 [Phycisphaerales bacterium]|nr:MAG: hypothetical protein JSV19_10335 [Phycisphaerales bacterium]
MGSERDTLIRSRPGPRRGPLPPYILFDVLVLLGISLVAEGIAFSAPQGRAVINGDSAQYVAVAEALVRSDQSAHFELRKPGYPLFLAAVKLAFGHLGWAAIVCNHGLLVLLPLAAYGFGLHLHSRVLGWVAAGLTIVQLQSAVLGNRIMSEVLYTVLLSFGLLTFAVGLRRTGAGWWLAGSGLLLAFAWLTRGAATAVIPVAGVAVAVVYRCDRRKLAALSGAFVFPIVCVILFECLLNCVCAGRFRISSGAAGATMWAYRGRYFQGTAMPPTADADRILALLPERTVDEAFLCNSMDQWVARYRAVHDAGWEEWEFDRACRRMAVATIRSDPVSFLGCSARLALHHLLRRGEAFSLSRVPQSKRRAAIAHPAIRSPSEVQTHWYAYWGLPHLPLEGSMQLVDRLQAEASVRAPFGGSKVWTAFRYWKTKPPMDSLMDASRRLGDLWPGFALLLCGVLGLNRTTCCVLAAAYVLEALLIGFVTVTTERFQFVWLATDTTLAAALPVGVLAWVAQHGRTRWSTRRVGARHTCGVNIS